MTAWIPLTRTNKRCKELRLWIRLHPLQAGACSGTGSSQAGSSQEWRARFQTHSAAPLDFLLEALGSLPKVWGMFQGFGAVRDTTGLFFWFVIILKGGVPVRIHYRKMIVLFVVAQLGVRSQSSTYALDKDIQGSISQHKWIGWVAFCAPLDLRVRGSPILPAHLHPEQATRNYTSTFLESSKLCGWFCIILVKAPTKQVGLSQNRRTGLFKKIEKWFVSLCFIFKLTNKTGGIKP